MVPLEQRDDGVRQSLLFRGRQVHEAPLLLRVGGGFTGTRVARVDVVRRRRPEPTQLLRRRK